MATRMTRSRTRQQPESQEAEPTSTSSTPRLMLQNPPNTTKVSSLGIALSRSTTDLTEKNSRLLELKQRKLRDPQGQIPAFIRTRNSVKCRRNPSSSPNADFLGRAAAATLVFAQEEAGTAICISPDGFLLTCSHCVAETYEEFQQKEDKWLLFASGSAVRARCVAWDSRRDLALLQIVAAQDYLSETDEVASFPCASIASTQEQEQLLYVGHPGSEDLEASRAGIATNYDVLHISTGGFRGLAEGQDPQYNSEIGASMHDCWTYWGHSGAPLISRNSGSLVGLHSSWDDETGVRRGVPLAAIKAFLNEHTLNVLDG